MILDEIVFNKRQEVILLKIKLDIKKAKKAISNLPRPRSFKKALKVKGVSIIAEVKRASPSAGVIKKSFKPVEIAQNYEKNGAAAISVLTDEKYFKGKLDYLKKIRSKVRIPILRKDFIIDESQIYESRLARADAILLIVRILTDEELKRFLALSKKLKMDALVEVHNGKEAERALAAGADIIGINNRDLDTLEVNINNTLELIDKFWELSSKIIVSESGISSPEQVRTLKQKGVAAILVGESLLKSKKPSDKLRELLNA
ncbi:MAG: indole-3-glycerol phosphate synthase TrpC [Candidatus Margulisiibacteriota bacterium]